MNFRLRFLILISVSILLTVISIPTLAEVSGTINVGNITDTTGIVTGIYGSSYYPYCYSDSDCASGDRCALDWDGISYSPYYGWCALSGTSCANDSSQDLFPVWYVHGYRYCNGTWARSCSSGSWGYTNCAATGKTCVDGVCISNVTTTTNPDSSGTSDTTTTTVPSTSSSLSTTHSPSDLDIIQGESKLEQVTVKNVGENTLLDVEISLTGIQSSWYNFTKTKFSVIDLDDSATYIINFSIPSDATIESYDITVDITASDSTTTTASFKLKVLPSNETVEGEIKPRYANCSKTLDELRNKISSLEQRGKNVTEIQGLLDSAMDNLNQINSSLESGDYFTANELIQGTLVLIDDINLKIAGLEVDESDGDNIFVILIVAIVAIIIITILTYLFLPDKYMPKFIPTRRALTIPKLGSGTKFSRPVLKRPGSNLKRPGSNSGQKQGRLLEIKDTISRLKRSKKQQKKEKFRYEFKR